MPPDRFLLDATPGEQPSHENVQQIIEAEAGKGSQGIARRWLASNSAATVLTSDASGVKISNDNGATPPSHVLVDGSAASGALSGVYPNPSLAPATLDLLAPPGAVVAYAGPVWPVGWLPCDGRSVARADYPRLFAAIGVTWGAVDGASFNVPNLLGRVILCISGAHALGTTGGAESVLGPTHTHPQAGSGHTHSIALHGHTSPQHAHGLALHSHPIGAHTHGQNGHTHTSAMHAHDLNNHTHDTPITHDHLSAHPTGTAGPTGINGLATLGGVNLPTTTHYHDFDVPAIAAGVTRGSGVPLPVNGSGTTTPAATGGPSNANTQGPSADDTANSTLAGTSSTTDTVDANTAPTATGPDASAPAANYAGAVVATMMPFGGLLYIIRAV
ncbi:MAG TPA: phage tail protein [Acidimicrobiales bacterium]